MNDQPEQFVPRRLTLEEVFPEPWQQLGESRRDAEPHRGKLLRRMARLSLIAGCLSCFGLPFNVIGLPLGLIAWMMARRDRDRIVAGDMDHRGYHPTEKARSDAFAGVVLNLLAVPITLCAGTFVYVARAVGPWLSSSGG